MWCKTIQNDKFFCRSKFCSLHYEMLHETYITISISNWGFMRQNIFEKIINFNFFKNFLAVVIPGASEAIECSTKLFPHFIHVCNLTTDFINRAAKVIKIPQHRFSFERTKVHFKVHQLDTLTTQSKFHGQGLCPFFSFIQKIKLIF